MMEKIILKVTKDKELSFLVDSITKKILDESEYLKYIIEAAAQLLELGEDKEVIISDENKKDILRIQVQHKTKLVIEEIK